MQQANDLFPYTHHDIMKFFNHVMMRKMLSEYMPGEAIYLEYNDDLSIGTI